MTFFLLAALQTDRAVETIYSESLLCELCQPERAQRDGAFKKHNTRPNAALITQTVIFGSNESLLYEPPKPVDYNKWQCLLFITYPVKL